MLLDHSYDITIIWHFYLYILYTKLPVYQSFKNIFHHLIVPSLNYNTLKKHITAVYRIIGQNRSFPAITMN